MGSGSFLMAVTSLPQKKPFRFLNVRRLLIFCFPCLTLWNKNLVTCVQISPFFICSSYMMSPIHQCLHCIASLFTVFSFFPNLPCPLFVSHPFPLFSPFLYLFPRESHFPQHFYLTVGINNSHAAVGCYYVYSVND